MALNLTFVFRKYLLGFPLFENDRNLKAAFFRQFASTHNIGNRAIGLKYKKTKYFENIKILAILHSFKL